MTQIRRNNLRFCLRANLTILLTLCAFATTEAQITSRPRQSIGTTAQPQQLTAQQPISRVGCDSCPASLRILADMDCAVTVDGVNVGTISQDAGKTVQVDLGEHAVVAQTGKLRWESNITVDKPGQRLIKTQLRVAKMAEPWQGKWFTQLYYQESKTSGLHAYYFESYQIEVRGVTCRMEHRDGFDVTDGSPNYKMSTDWSDCRFEEDGALTNGRVRATIAGTQRNLEFKTIWTDKIYTMPLTDEATARQAVANAQQAEADRQQATIRRWAGHWEGEASDKQYVGDNGTYTTTKVSLTIDVDDDGGCAAVSTWSDTFHFRGGPGDPPAVNTRYGKCTITDQRKLHISLGEFDDVIYTSSGNAVVRYSSLGVSMTINLVRR